MTTGLVPVPQTLDTPGVTSMVVFESQDQTVELRPLTDDLKIKETDHGTSTYESLDILSILRGQPISPSVNPGDIIRLCDEATEENRAFIITKLTSSNTDLAKRIFTRYALDIEFSECCLK